MKRKIRYRALAFILSFVVAFAGMPLPTAGTIAFAQTEAEGSAGALDHRIRKAAPVLLVMAPAAARTAPILPVEALLTAARALREAVQKAHRVLQAAAQAVSLALLKAAAPPRVVPAALIAAAQAVAPAVKKAGIQRVVPVLL